MAGITITPEALAESARQYRQDILMMPVFRLRDMAKYMTVRTGVRFGEMVGELEGDLQLAPYSESRKDTNAATIKGRELKVYLGNVDKKFSPNSVYQTIYGSGALKGDALKNVPITRIMLEYLAGKMGENIYDVVWSAKRNASGNTSADLFDGWDTITAAEITGGGIAANKGNFVQLSAAITSSNAGDVLKSIWRATDKHIKFGQKKVQMFVSPEIKEAYDDWYLANVGPVVYNKEFEQTVLIGSNGLCEIIALPNKAGSKFITVTTKENLLIGCNNESDGTTVAVEKYDPWQLDFVAAMIFGAQFESVSKERLFVAKLYEDPAAEAAA